MSVRAAPFWLVLACAASAVGQTLPRGYEVVQVTDNPWYEPFPRINNNGQVVFMAWLDNVNRETEEIFLYDSRTGELAQLTDDNVQDVSPDINDDGTIVWIRGLGPWDPRIGVFTGEIMMRTPDGVITRITDNIEQEGAPRINNLGQIVWHRDGDWGCGGAVRDIYLFDSGNIVPITTNRWSEQVDNQRPAINDLGQIAWTEYDFCDPPFPYNFTSRIMLYRDGQTFQLTTTQSLAQAPDINNLLQVVWGHHDRALGVDYVQLWEGGKTSTLAEGAVPSINERGDVAFHAVVGTTFEIQLLRNGLSRQLPSDRVYNVVPSLNDRGEVAWTAGGWPDADIRVLRRFADGDMNCDGRVDAVDIEPFVIALVRPESYDLLFPLCDPLLGDFNGSGGLDGFDIEGFVDALD